MLKDWEQNNVQMNRQISLLLTGLLFLLGGCSFAPQYVQPEAPIPAAWPQGAAYQETTRELSWRELFVDPLLQKIIDMALKSNRDLRMATLNVERARAMYGVQQSERYPAINAIGAGGKQRRSADLIPPGEPRGVEQYGINLGIAAWEIDFFGRVRNLKDQALEAYLATDEVRRGAQIALVAEIARTYLTLGADQENFNLAQKTLATQQQIYALIQKSYAIGFATQLDVRRAQTPVEIARGDVARYAQRVTQDKNTLTLVVGGSIPESLLPVDLNSIVPPREVSVGLPSELLLRRPDILAAEHQLKAAYAFIGAARSAFFPRISLTTTLGTASNELSGLFNSGTETWNFSPQIAMPIFDARTWAAYRVSKADQKIALTRYEKSIQTAFKEVADALAIRKTMNQQVAAQEALSTAVEESYRLSYKRYTGGIGNYLSVLDAQRSLYGAQQKLTTIRLARRMNQVQFYAILGGGTK